MGTTRNLLLAGILAWSVLGSTSPALAAGSGGMSAPPPQNLPSARDESRQRSPAQLASAAHNKGVRILKKAERHAGNAASASDEGKRFRAGEKSRAAFADALEQFRLAIEHQPRQAESWNYIGYCERNLGQHAAALEAYERALALKPKFPEAIEYRGEAYLGLHRLDDAKQAYLDLYASARPLAEQLLRAMQTYVEARRAAPDGVDPQALDAFATWVAERGSIAQETAALDPGSAAGWR